MATNDRMINHSKFFNRFDRIEENQNQQTKRKIIQTIQAKIVKIQLMVLIRMKQETQH